MPEDKPIPSRSAAPENDNGKLRPTVITPSPKKAQSPTARPSKASGTEAPVRPTVIKKAAANIARSGKPLASGRRAAERLVAGQPTAIPGVERKRIDVGVGDIRKLSPQARPGVPERAVRLVEGLVVVELRDRQAVLWGHRLQQEYSDLVSRTLELSQADVLRRVTSYIGRMTDILESIDLEAVADAPPSVGIIGQYFKKVSRKIDSPEELSRARLELDQLVKLMGTALEQLLTLKETLERYSRDIEAMGDEVEASALAAEFMSAHLREGHPALSQRFVERSMSLTQTVAQIRGSAVMRDEQIEQPLRLIGAIQNVALVTVPGWLGSIAGLTAMLAGKRKLTPTETGELVHQLGNILQQLKT